MDLRAIFVALAFLAVLAPSAASEPGAPTVYILHDAPDDGFTYVGNPNHFGYVLLNAARATQVHQQGKIKVEQNGVVLYETTLDASHDYNALNSFEVAFPMVGPYNVHAEVPISGSVVAAADFGGYVHPNPATTVASIDLQSELSGRAGIFTFFLKDAKGALIPHSDAFFEVRRPGDDWLVFRTHLHTHEEKMVLTYAFPAAGDYLVRVVGYNAFPTEDGPFYAPAAVTKKVTVGEGAGPGAPDLKAAAGSPPYQLLTTIDPQDKSSPFSRFVMSALVFDPKADRFIPHVNFEAAIVDAVSGATLYKSNTLHEYDGHYEATFAWPTVGSYKFVVNAIGKGWVQRAELPFTVSVSVPAGPPAVAAMVVTAKGLDALKSGAPQKITFSAATPAGTPASHSEIDYQIVRTPWGPPLLANKLHTHASATFEMQATFPEAGDYLLILDPVTIHGEVTPNYYYGKVGGSLVVPIKVAPGTPLADVALPAPAPALKAPSALPGFEVAFLTMALLMAFRRRV